MKKNVLALVAVVCALYAGVTTWMGGRSEKAFRNWVGQVSQMSDVRVLESTYARGWLHSGGSLSFELRGPVGEAFRGRLEGLGREDVRGRIGVRAEHDIDHSGVPLWRWLRTGREGAPILALVESRLELDQESQSELAGVIGRMPEMQVESHLRSSGVVETRVAMPARELEPKLGKNPPTASARGKWHGLSGVVVFAPDGSSFAGHLQSPGLELHSQEWSLRVADVSVKLDLARDATGIWLGSASQRIGSLVSSPSQGGAGLQLHGWTLQQRSEAADGALHFEFSAKLDALSAGRSQWGPGRMKLALREVDAALVTALRGGPAHAPDHADDGLASVPDAGAAFPSDVSDSEALAVPLPAVLQTLASRPPVLALEDFELGTPGGPVLAEARVTLNASAGSPIVALSPLAAVEAQLELSGPVPVFEILLADRPGGMAGMEENGLLERVGERMQLRVALGGGVLRVNGVPLEGLPLPGGMPQPETPADLAGTALPGR